MQKIRTPEQAHMPLMYAPYVPSLWEDLILRNWRILANQMEFLMAHLPKTSRLRTWLFAAAVCLLMALVFSQINAHYAIH